MVSFGRKSLLCTACSLLRRSATFRKHLWPSRLRKFTGKAHLLHLRSVQQTSAAPESDGYLMLAEKVWPSYPSSQYGVGLFGRKWWYAVKSSFRTKWDDRESWIDRITGPGRQRIRQFGFHGGTPCTPKHINPARWRRWTRETRRSVEGAPFVPTWISTR